MMIFATYFHDLFVKSTVSKGLPPKSAGMPLSARERACLILSARGLSSEDIGEGARDIVPHGLLPLQFYSIQADGRESPGSDRQGCRGPSDCALIHRVTGRGYRNGARALRARAHLGEQHSTSTTQSPTGALAKNAADCLDIDAVGRSRQTWRRSVADDAMQRLAKRPLRLP